MPPPPVLSRQAGRELRADPARSDAVIAAAAQCSQRLVCHVRAALEQSGQIPPQPRAARTPRAPQTWQPWTRRPVIGKAVHELVDDPARSNELIAAVAGCSHNTVARARAKLESIGLIQVVPVSQRLAAPRPQQPSPARDAIAILGPDATPRQVAELAGVSLQAAWKALSRFSQARQRDLAAATDQLTVRATADCERCHASFTFVPRPNRPARRWCGPDCRRPVRDPSAHHPPPIPELPAFDFSKGLCTHVPASQATWWTSDDPFLREAAAEICTACPLLIACAEWSLHLPARDTAIYGGLTAADRRAIRAGHLPPWLRGKRGDRRLAAIEKPPPRNLR